MSCLRHDYHLWASMSRTPYLEYFCFGHQPCFGSYAWTNYVLGITIGELSTAGKIYWVLRLLRFSSSEIPKGKWNGTV